MGASGGCALLACVLNLFAGGVIIIIILLFGNENVPSFSLASLLPYRLFISMNFCKASTATLALLRGNLASLFCTNFIMPKTGSFYWF
jgi:hypothetical protein